MSDHGRDTEAEDEGPEGLMREERRALTNSQQGEDRGNERQRGGESEESMTGDESLVNQGEQDLGSE